MKTSLLLYIILKEGEKNKFLKIKFEMYHGKSSDTYH